MQMKRRQRARELPVCLQKTSIPNLTTIHASRNNIRFSEPQRSVRPVCQSVFTHKSTYPIGSFHYPPHHPFGSGWHHLQQSLTGASWGAGWVLTLKELRNLLPSFMYIPLVVTTLPNLSIRDMHVSLLLSTITRSRFQVLPSWCPWSFPYSFWWRSYTITGSTRVAFIP
jgi:hypothetical protein